MTTASYLTNASNETYSTDAFEYIQRFSGDITEISTATGISSGAIAGAMAEENTAYNWLDIGLDIYAKSAVDPAVAAVTLPAAIALGAPGMTAWLAANTALLVLNRSHDKWLEEYNSVAGFTGAPSEVDKILHPSLIDAGPGNFKIKTAIDLVVEYADDYPSLGFDVYLNDYASLVEDLMDDRNPLTAQLYGVYMKEKAETWFIENNAYGEQWDDLPQTYKDALLVTFTNRGKESMEKLLPEAGSGLPFEPQPGLTTSGGINHFLNADNIGDAIGLPSYGDDITVVNDFASQAKMNNDVGLASRYALYQLRYTVIAGLDYSSHNTNGELDLYDPVTGHGQITESYIEDRSAFLNYWIEKVVTDETPTAVELAEYHDLATDKLVFVDAPSHASPAKQYIFGTENAEVINGLDNIDHLYGGAGNDILDGKGGADYLEGGQGADHLNGGAGFDTYHTDNGDVITDTDGQGQVFLQGQELIGGRHLTDDPANTFTDTGIDINSTEDDIVYTVENNENGTTNITVSSHLDDNAQSFLIENYNDGDLGIVFSDHMLTTLHGRHDRVFGSQDSDTIRTLDQDDFIVAEGGGDRIYAGTGNDMISADAGNDIVYGEAGQDSLSGDAFPAVGGDDKLYGGDGNDLIEGMNGDDLLVADNRIDDINVAVQMGQGDWLNGGKGNDELYGSARADLMAGGAGSDTLKGGAGDDVLTGDGDYDSYYVPNYGPVSGSYTALQLEIELGALLAVLGGMPGLYLSSIAIASQLQNSETPLANGGIGVDWLWNGVAEEFERR